MTASRARDLARGVAGDLAEIAETRMQAYSVAPSLRSRKVGSVTLRVGPRFEAWASRVARRVESTLRCIGDGSGAPWERAE